MMLMVMEASGGFPTDLDDFDTLEQVNTRVDTNVVVVEVEGGVPAVEEYQTYEEVIDVIQTYEDIVEVNTTVEAVTVPAQVEVDVEQTSTVTATATRLAN
jgi:hypothetical protein